MKWWWYLRVAGWAGASSFGTQFGSGKRQMIQLTLMFNASGVSSITSSLGIFASSHPLYLISNCSNLPPVKTPLPLPPVAAPLWWWMMAWDAPRSGLPTFQSSNSSNSCTSFPFSLPPLADTPLVRKYSFPWTARRNSELVTSRLVPQHTWSSEACRNTGARSFVLKITLTVEWVHYPPVVKQGHPPLWLSSTSGCLLMKGTLMSSSDCCLKWGLA